MMVRIRLSFILLVVIVVMFFLHLNKGVKINFNENDIPELLRERVEKNDFDFEKSISDRIYLRFHIFDGLCFCYFKYNGDNMLINDFFILDNKNKLLEVPYYKGYSRDLAFINLQQYDSVSGMFYEIPELKDSREEKLNDLDEINDLICNLEKRGIVLDSIERTRLIIYTLISPLSLTEGSEGMCNLNYFFGDDYVISIRNHEEFVNYYNLIKRYEVNHVNPIIHMWVEKNNELIENYLQTNIDYNKSDIYFYTVNDNKFFKVSFLKDSKDCKKVLFEYINKQFIWSDIQNVIPKPRY